jgi:hypothetical protein
MGQAGPIVITGGRKKDLGFMFQPTKGLAVDDPVPIPLKSRTEGAFGFRAISPPALDTPGGPGG